MYADSDEEPPERQVDNESNSPFSLLNFPVTSNGTVKGSDSKCVNKQENLSINPDAQVAREDRSKRYKICNTSSFLPGLVPDDESKNNNYPSSSGNICKKYREEVIITSEPRCNGMAIDQEECRLATLSTGNNNN